MGTRFGILRLLCSFRYALSTSIIKPVVIKEDRHFLNDLRTTIEKEGDYVLE